MINLLYCGNENVFDGLLISLLSITKHTADPLHVYVMTMDLTDVDEKNKPIRKAQIDYLKTILQEKNAGSTIRLIDISEMFCNEMLSSPNLMSSYTPYTLVRLFADQIEGMPERILYLDTDTMANDDISPIFQIDITGYAFAGVIDYLGKVFIRYDYMNAGILYLNMKHIKQTNLFGRARKMCREKKMWFPDQTALNRLVDKKLFIPTKYNEQRKLRNDTVLQHFCKSVRFLPYYHTVNVKPWQVDRIHSVYKLHAYDDILNEYQMRIEKIEVENHVSSENH